MDLAAQFQNIKTVNELGIFIEDTLISECLPPWCVETDGVKLWIDKAKNEENLSVINALTQLCLKYSQVIVKDEEKDSMVCLYLKLNPLAELVFHWTASEEWLQLSFWEAISELQLSILKAYPNKLHCYLLDLGNILLKTTMKSSLPLYLRQLRIKSLNNMLEECPTHIRVAFMEDIKTKLPMLLSMLQDVGDYDYQTSIVETIYRITLHHERVKGIADWLPHLDADTKFLFIQISDFDPDCRKFLNAYNKSLGSKCQVFSFHGLSAAIGKFELRKPKVASYEYLWIDFNMGSKTVSLLFDHADPAVPTQDRIWETIMVYANEVEKASLQISDEFCVLKLLLNKSPLTIFASPPSASAVRQLSSEFTLNFHFNKQLEDLCTVLFQSRLKISRCDTEISSRSSVTKDKITISSQEDFPLLETKRIKESESVCKIVNNSSEMLLSEADIIPGTYKDENVQGDKSGWSITGKQKICQATGKITVSLDSNDESSNKGAASTSEKQMNPKTVQKLQKVLKGSTIPSLIKHSSETTCDEFPQRLSSEPYQREISKLENENENLDSILENLDSRTSDQVLDNVEKVCDTNQIAETVYKKISLEDIFDIRQGPSESISKTNVSEHKRYDAPELNDESDEVDIFNGKYHVESVKKSSLSSQKEQYDKNNGTNDSNLTAGINLMNSNVSVENKSCDHNGESVAPDNVNKVKLCTPLITTLEILSKYPMVVKEQKTPPGKLIAQKKSKSTSSKFFKSKFRHFDSPKSEDKKRTGKSRKSLFNSKSCTLLDKDPTVEDDVEVISLGFLTDNKKQDSRQDRLLFLSETKNDKELVMMTPKPAERTKKNLKKRKKSSKAYTNNKNLPLSSDSSFDVRPTYKKPKYIKQSTKYQKNKCSTPKTCYNAYNFCEHEKNLKLSKISIYSDFSDTDESNLNWLDGNSKTASRSLINKPLKNNRTYCRKSSIISDSPSSRKKKKGAPKEPTLRDKVAATKHSNDSSQVDSGSRRIVTRSFAKKMSQNASRFESSILQCSSPEILRNKSLTNLTSMDERLTFDSDFSLAPAAGSKIVFPNEKYSDIAKDLNDSKVEFFNEILPQNENCGEEQISQSSESLTSLNSNGNAVYVDPAAVASVKESMQCISERNAIQMLIDSPEQRKSDNSVPRIRYVRDHDSTFCSKAGTKICETLTQSPCLNDNLHCNLNCEKSPDKSSCSKSYDVSTTVASGCQQTSTTQTAVTADSSTYKSLSKEYSSYLALSQAETSADLPVKDIKKSCPNQSLQKDINRQGTPFTAKPQFQTPKLAQRKLFTVDCQAKKDSGISSSVIRLLLDEISIVRKQAEEINMRCNLISDVLVELFEDK